MYIAILNLLVAEVLTQSLKIVPRTKSLTHTMNEFILLSRYHS